MDDKKDLLNISVGILAGGESTRMGEDKALIRIGNERIIDRLTSELSPFHKILISAAKHGIYDDLGYPVVYDEHARTGPIEGIRRVLQEADTEYVFVCAADMPNIKKELVSYLAGYISSDYDCYVIADEDHIQPLCAIYSKAVLPVIEKLMEEGRYRLREILKRVRTRYISLEYTCFDSDTVRNINTRQDLLDMIKPIVFCVSGYSDSGKTGLIEKLINEFIAADMTVGVIKHDGHESIKDAPGCDTSRARDAGAICTAVYSDREYILHFGESTGAAELIEHMKGLKSPPDVIILEGLKTSYYPKIEVVRKKVCDRSVCEESTLICIASDCISPESVSCPVYGADDVKGIFLCLKEYFGIR